MSTKYMRVYNDLILKAKLRQDIVGYTENHHINPKAFGGDNTKSNIAVLTAREHYIAHLLLYFHYSKYGTDKQSSSMAYALLYFLSTSRENRTPNRLVITAGKSRMYNKIRESLSKARSGKPLIDIIGEEGYKKYLNSHKERRKYTDNFEWVNKSETFYGSPYELSIQYNIPVSGLIKVAYKTSKTSRGWSLKNSNIERVVKKHEKYCKLINYKTLEIFEGTIKDIALKFSLPIRYLTRVLAKKTLTAGDLCLESNAINLNKKYIEKHVMLHTFVNSITGDIKILSASSMAKFVKDPNIHILVNTHNTIRKVRNWQLKESNE